MRTKVLAFSAAALMACSVGVGQSNDDVVRQGAGERRAQLNSMELTAVEQSLFSGLSQWTNGGPISAADLQGKVTLIMTWSTWYPPANRMLPTVQRIASRYADQGLTVLVVHRAPEWDEAVKSFKEMPKNMILAQDDGTLRSRLLAAQDPEFYVIDRAGQMRFAAVDNRSVENAVEIAIKETADQAGAIPTALATAAAQKEDERWRTRGVSREYLQVLRGAEDLEFELPDASAYGAARWPTFENQGGGYGQADSVGDFASLMNGWTWLTRRPAVQGKVVVVDFWRTWCGPCIRAIPGLEALQREYRNELAIIAISSPDDRGESESKVRAFLAGKNPEYFYAFDESKSFQDRIGIDGFPTVLVVSSDGVIRWKGNPHSRDFRTAVTGVIANDPGVRARRAARTQLLERLESEQR
jgi:thiol-disulfide isomerase/thioredoxin